MRTYRLSTIYFPGSKWRGTVGHRALHSQWLSGNWKRFPICARPSRRRPPHFPCVTAGHAQPYSVTSTWWAGFLNYHWRSALRLKFRFCLYLDTQNIVILIFLYINTILFFNLIRKIPITLWSWDINHIFLTHFNSVIPETLQAMFTLHLQHGMVEIT